MRRHIPVTDPSEACRQLLQALADTAHLPYLRELEVGEGADYTWSAHDHSILMAALREYARTMADLPDIARRAEQLARIADAGFETVTKDLQEAVS